MTTLTLAPLFATSALVLAANAPLCAATDIFINEWNSVGSQKWLGNPSAGTTDCPQPDGPNGVGCSSNEDVYLGRRLGNGSDWVELVVATDHLDIRGWRLQWVELAGEDADGATDIWYGNPTAPQGEVVFNAHPLWADLRAGTIITIIENTSADGGLDTDTSFDPCTGDWWINVCLNDGGGTELVSAVANVVDPTNPSYDDPMDVGNDNWQGRIINQEGAIHIGLVGEGTPSWLAGGVNSRECCRLEAQPGSAVTVWSRYEDGDSSSFGQPNGWSDPVTSCKEHQDFTALRQSVRAETCATCTQLTLNEYNAVDPLKFLNGGTQEVDSELGQASDVVFGRVAGNGGDWMEFVVIADGLDLRGATIQWWERDTGAWGTLELANASGLGNLPAGTIVTLTERSAAEGGRDTDLSLGEVDHWINLNSHDTAVVVGTTGSAADHVSGQFATSNQRWGAQVFAADGQPMSPAQGEGASFYYLGGVSDAEVCRLREDPAGTVDGASAFDDLATSSSFGQANTWITCSTSIESTQDFGHLPESGCVGSGGGTTGDVNGDGSVNGQDLAILLGAWGTASTGVDLSGDGIVGGADLTILLGAWTG